MGRSENPRGLGSNGSGLHCRAGFVLVCLVLQLTQSARAAPSIEVLCAAAREWERGLQFKCTFSYREGVCKSWEDGAQGNFLPGKVSKEGFGQMCRMGTLVHVQMDWKGPMKFTPLGGAKASSQKGGMSGAMIGENVPFDACCDDRIEIHRQPAKGGGEEFAILTRRTDAPSGGSFARTEFQGKVSPLSPAGVSLEKILSLERNPAADEEQPLVEEVVEVDATHIEVRMSRKGRSVEQRRTIRFWTEPSPPVIDGLTFWSRAPGLPVPNETRIQLSDFTKCGDLYISRRVRNVVNAIGGQFFVREWASDDIGKEPPTREDFVVKMNPESKVYGLSQGSEVVDGVRRIDPVAIAVSDLGRHALGEELPGPGYGSWLLLVSLTALAIVAMVAWVAVRRKRLG